MAAVLAEVAPRVRVERERVWVDARGLPAQELLDGLRRVLASAGVCDVRAGVADVPVVAWAAARFCADATVFPSSTHPLFRAFVPSGQERAFLSAFPLAPLLEVEAADPQVLAWLEGVGVGTCGELALLEREAVEVRFGVEGVRLWRLARADDARVLFEPVPPERPQATLDFVDYVVTDPERLAFTVNALLGSLCDALRARGEHARRLRLVLELASGGRWEQGLHPGRPTASRAVWLRLARAALERAALPDAVAGVHLEVEATEPAAVRQGDLFDAGFATAPAVEAAVLRLLESQGEVLVRPEVDGHPLAERRIRWRPVAVDEVVAATAPGTRAHTAEGAAAASMVRRSWAAEPPKRGRDSAATLSRSSALPLSRSRGGVEEGSAALTLQLLERPREIQVETALRRDYAVPARYREMGAAAAARVSASGTAAPDSPGSAPSTSTARSAGSPAWNHWHSIVSVAGPERISGGVWEDAYAREYFRALTADGALLWLFRDARRAAWYLHGWWD